MKSPTSLRGAAPAAGEPADHDAAEAPSKSQRKRDMLELQQLGESLAQLPRARIDVLDVPETLRDALREWSRLRSFEGRRRHAQYIGKLMRKVDPEPLRQALLEATGESRAAVARLHQLEDWRERLLADDSALAELVREHPGAAVQELRQCIRAARAERAGAKPPRQYRLLYQHLKALLLPDAPAHDPAEPDDDALLPD
ncbi:MAG: DUF615 domain-containing protein [Betaproteobacteria bacterium]|nr:DUF615 domain-containing protein [Betaproteobacteria bacterium]